MKNYFYRLASDTELQEFWKSTELRKNYIIALRALAAEQFDLSRKYIHKCLQTCKASLFFRVLATIEFLEKSRLHALFIILKGFFALSRDIPVITPQGSKVTAKVRYLIKERLKILFLSLIIIFCPRRIWHKKERYQRKEGIVMDPIFDHKQYKTLSEMYDNGEYKKVRERLISSIQNISDENLFQVISSSRDWFREETEVLKRIRKAINIYEKGKLGKALELLIRLEKEEPDNVMLQTWLGTVYEAQGKQKEALEHYQRAINLLSSDDQYKKEILKRIFAIQKEIGEEEDILKTIHAITILPDIDFSDLDEISHFLNQKKKSDVLIKILERIEDETTDPEMKIFCSTTLSDLYYNKSDLRKTEEYLKNALYYAPDSVSHLSFLSDILFDLHNYQEASRICKSILDKTCPEEYYYYNAYIRLLYCLSAIGEKENIVELNTFEAPSMLSKRQKFDLLKIRHELYLSLDMHDESISCLESIIEEYQEFSNTKFWPITHIAFYYYNSGKYEAAAKHFQHVVDKNKNDKVSLFYLAQCLSMIEVKKDEALSIWKKVLEQFPPNSLWHEIAQRNLNIVTQ